jgi:hypothetical protein
MIYPQLIHHFVYQPLYPVQNKRTKYIMLKLKNANVYNHITLTILLKRVLLTQLHVI